MRRGFYFPATMVPELQIPLYVHTKPLRMEGLQIGGERGISLDKSFQLLSSVTRFVT